MQFKLWRNLAAINLYAVLILLACSSGDETENITPKPIPDSPTELTIEYHDGYNSLNWEPAVYAETYNVYFSTSSQISPLNATKLTKITPPFNHTALLNDVTYYYIITSVNGSGESQDSQGISATPRNNLLGIDPLYKDQWNLLNTGQESNLGTPGTPNEDINVSPVWDSCTSFAPNSCRGEGVLVAIVDDGLEIAHEDLFANIAVGKSYNFVNNGTDPTPFLDDEGHGTSVGGIIAARDQNNKGLKGVAPRAAIAAYKLLPDTTNVKILGSLTHDSDGDNEPDAQISNNSWGPVDDGNLFIPDSTWYQAINKGIKDGRGGLGVVYIWAAGNGARAVGPDQLYIDDQATGACDKSVDNSNYDGFANYRGVIAVAAVTDKGKKAFYSECGANILVSAPAGESCRDFDYHSITTTDLSGELGFNPTNGVYNYNNVNYNKCFSGTSAAAPSVSGVVALILQANPSLSWRDVRLILTESARKNDLEDTLGWQTNGANKRFNHAYGFGVVDAEAAVNLAKTWTKIGPQLAYSTPTKYVAQSIPPNGNTAITNNITISGSGINAIEFVEIIVDASPYDNNNGDLEITLTHLSSNTVSYLAYAHKCYKKCEQSYKNWTFGSVTHLGESADGVWQLSVKDNDSNKDDTNTGLLQSWQLKIYGT